MLVFVVVTILHPSVQVQCLMPCGCATRCPCLCRCIRLQDGRTPPALDAWRLVLIIDTREKMGGDLTCIANALRQQSEVRGVTVEIDRAQLPVGDYLWVWRQGASRQVHADMHITLIH